MVTCTRPDLAPSSAYRYHKCRCARCSAWRKQARISEDKELARRRARKWRLLNPERSRNNSKHYQQCNPDKVLEWQLRKYGLKAEEYNRMLSEQDGLCAICKQPPSDGKRLGVDHDHRTGTVRALLCGNCNTGIGKFKDSIATLISAIVYLLRFRKESNV